MSQRQAFIDALGKDMADLLWTANTLRWTQNPGHGVAKTKL